MQLIPRVPVRIAFIIFLLVFSLVLGLATYFVYHTVAYFGVLPEPYLLDAALPIFAVLPVMFILTSFLSRSRNNSTLRFFYSVSSFWLGIITYLFFASFLSWIIYILQGAPLNPQAGAIVHQTVFAIAIIVCGYGLWNGRRPAIRELSIKLENLPPAWQHKTAVLFADSHLGLIHGKKFMRKIVETTAALNPDVIFIAGDVFDGPTMDFVDGVSPLAKLQPSMGIHFAFGNHDEFVGNDQLVTDALTKIGVNILRDSFIEVQGMQIMGLDYRMSEKFGKISDVLAHLAFARNKPSILLFHAPVNIKEIEQAGVSLMLSGHTHKGQIFPFNYVSRLIYGRFHYGLNKSGRLTIYTTNGVGTWGPLMRVGNRPEIVKIQFE